MVEFALELLHQRGAIFQFVHFIERDHGGLTPRLDFLQHNLDRLDLFPGLRMADVHHMQQQRGNIPANRVVELLHAPVREGLGALLQLGAGFHPDLTGVENLWLNASLLGLSRKRTGEVFESIVDFAGIEDFIAEPLRTYSSGMVMRLAFSVAVHMDPEIFIVDEVLAVGDHAFQAKCQARILEFKQAGKTLIAVSHEAAGVKGLCERAIWLDHGCIVREGALAEVVAAYEGRS